MAHDGSNKNRSGEREGGMESRKYLLCLAHKYGYGNWDLVKAAIRRSDRFRFDYFLRSCSADALGKRCEALMKAAEKEDAEWHRRQGTERGLGPGGSERLSEEERRKAAERERSNQYKDFQGKVAQESDKLTEQHSDKSELRDSLQSDGHNGAGSGENGSGGGSGINGNNGGSGGGGDTSGSGSSGVSPGPDNVDWQMAFLAAQNLTGGGSSSSRPQGQAKPVPDCLVGELSRFVCRSGSKGIDKIVSDFTAVHPEASKRQVEKKIQEIAYKEKRTGDVRDSWYIREGFEGLLDEGLGKHYPPGEALQADAEAKDRAKVRKKEEDGKDDDVQDKDKTKKRKAHADGERPSVTSRSQREAAFQALQDEGLKDPTPEEVKDRIKLAWRQLDEAERGAFENEAEKTGWVKSNPDMDSHNGDDRGAGGRRRVSLGGDLGLGGASPPGSPPSAFTIPKRRKIN